jgi:hypothetical protein
MQHGMNLKQCKSNCMHEFGDTHKLFGCMYFERQMYVQGTFCKYMYSMFVVLRVYIRSSIILKNKYCITFYCLCKKHVVINKKYVNTEPYYSTYIAQLEPKFLVLLPELMPARK